MIQTIRSRPRRARALLAALSLALPLAACGNDVPPNSVATVEDEVVKRETFNHWVAAAARGQQQPGQTTPVSVPDPPDFNDCVRAVQRQPVPKGAKKPTAEQAKTQCRQQYDGLKTQVMSFLVSAEWLEREAQERGIKVSDAQVRKEFESVKKQSFPDEKAYQQFLRQSAQTEQDVLFRVRLDMLSNEVRKKVVAGAGPVTDQEIRAYYDKNKQRFAQPERRDLSVVLTRNKARAEQAKSALEDGQSFRQVARRYSIDPASKSEGGKLSGVTRGQQEKALDDAVFGAKRGELQGPVKTQFGWYVFRVDRVIPATQQSFEQSKETIRNVVKGEKEQRALNTFIDDFQKQYREQTVCAEGFVTEQCKNGPTPKPASQQAAEQAQQAQGQQAPPQQAAPPPEE